MDNELLLQKLNALTERVEALEGKKREPRICASCGKPEDNHPYRHMFEPQEFAKQPEPEIDMGEIPHADDIVNQINLRVAPPEPEIPDEDRAECAEKDKRIAELKALLREAKRRHYYCADPWYSCPKADGGCANEALDDECDCGADEWNARIDAKLGEQE